MPFMIRRTAAAFALTASLAMADFRYEQSSRMTGGAMLGMMQMAAKFSKSAAQAQNTNGTVAVKGSQMVQKFANHATIYDLDKETITEIDTEKQTYSVVTFAEMRAFMEKAMKNATGGGADLQVDVKETGRKETLNGFPTREVLFTMKVEGNDPRNGSKSQMNFEMSTWLADKLPGYNEVTDFQVKMAQKMGFAGLGAQMAATQPGMARGMSEAMKKMASIGGVPVLQIVRMIPTDPQQLKQMEETQKQMAAAQAQQQGQEGGAQMPTGGQVASQAAGEAAAGAAAARMGKLGGLASSGLGGFGGLRRKKKQEQQEAPAAAPAETAAAPAEAPAPASGAPVKGSFSSEASMMEMTSESKDFSNAPLDGTLFEVPGGFKLVKSRMQ